MLVFRKLERSTAAVGVDRSAYLGSDQGISAATGRCSTRGMATPVVEMGLNDEHNDVLTAMFEEMEGQVTPEQLRLLFERVAGRVRTMDQELEKQNVLSTARLEEVGSKQWQQRADDGISLEVIELPETDSKFKFEEYEQKLEAAQSQESGRMKKIAIITCKGGTGKTTTAINLGHCLALSGKKVLIVDCDSQANVAMAFRNSRRRDLAELMTTGDVEIVNLRPNLYLIDSGGMRIVETELLSGEAAGARIATEDRCSRICTAPIMSFVIVRRR